MIFRIFVTFCCALGITFSAWGVTPPKEPQANDDVESYQRAMAQLEFLSSKGKLLTLERFKRLNWVGRTAAMNYTCSAQRIEDCRKVISFGLTDKALVVRDHALRIVLASSTYLPVEKSQIARDVLEDPRNYRTGAPLWIVDRARKYLEGFKG
jgi:hypothetical protein